jgi:hypothetical protein
MIAVDSDMIIMLKVATLPQASLGPVCFDFHGYV